MREGDEHDVDGQAEHHEAQVPGERLVVAQVLLEAALLVEHPETLAQRARAQAHRGLAAAAAQLLHVARSDNTGGDRDDDHAEEHGRHGHELR